MSDLENLVYVSKRALHNQLEDISSEANEQRMAAISGLVNDLNISMTENVNYRLTTDQL
jgi:hypothetical protein